jgi:hypothetical protein
MLLTTSRQAAAYDDYSYESMAADAVLARPLCLAVTIMGSALFVATLPVTLLSRSTTRAANVLVEKPAHATFRRKLGDLSALD